MEEPFFTKERRALIEGAGAHTGFMYQTEVMPSNCLPGVTDYVPGTDPGRYCFYTQVVRELKDGLIAIDERLKSDDDLESLRADVLEMNRALISMLTMIQEHEARIRTDGDGL